MIYSKFTRFIMVLVAVVAAAYLVSAVMLTRDQQPAPVGEDALTGTEGATSIIQNFHHIESHLDKVSWELNAEKAELLEDSANLFGIEMRFYTPEKEVISLTGAEGSVDLRTKNIVVTGDVTAVYNGNYYFYADRINWNADRRRLTSTGPVRIVGPEGEIRGAFLLAKLNRKKKFIIKGGVTVDFDGGNAQSSTGEGPQGAVS